MRRECVLTASQFLDNPVLWIVVLTALYYRPPSFYWQPCPTELQITAYYKRQRAAHCVHVKTGHVLLTLIPSRSLDSPVQQTAIHVFCIQCFSFCWQPCSTYRHIRILHSMLFVLLTALSNRPPSKYSAFNDFHSVDSPVLPNYRPPSTTMEHKRLVVFKSK